MPASKLHSSPIGYPGNKLPGYGSPIYHPNVCRPSGLSPKRKTTFHGYLSYHSQSFSSAILQVLVYESDYLLRPKLVLSMKAI